MKLYAYPPSPRAFKVLALANYLGLDYEFKLVDLTKGEHLRPEFVALNPNARMPVLEDDGFVLWESNAILQYLAALKPDSGLLPADLRPRADVTRWQFWESANWDPACSTIGFERVVKKFLGLGAPDPAEVARGEQLFARSAPVLDASLKGRRFITGDHLTVADFSLGAWLNVADVADYPIEPYSEIRRWYGSLIEMPRWRETIVMPPVGRVAT